MDTYTAAQQARVSRGTVRRWCRVGRVQAVKVGGRWVIEPASLPVGSGGQAMVRPVTVVSERRSWRGELVRTAHHYVEVTGRVVERVLTGQVYVGCGRLPVLVVDAGGVRVRVVDAKGGVYAETMRPVAVGDRVRILATADTPDTDYHAATIHKLQ